MDKKAKIITGVVCGLCAVGVATGLLCFFLIKPANGAQYSVKNCTLNENSSLKGKTIYWLGSSVTLGMESGNEAVSDYLAARNGCVCKKDAVSNTTLIDEPTKSWFSVGESYVTRLVNSNIFDKSERIDLFICQISTNDAKTAFLNKRGTILTNEFDKEQFDKDTTLGAMEYIVSYVFETWHCPIYFYSNAHFGDEGKESSDPTMDSYQSLVASAYDLADKWNAHGLDIKIIDLFSDVKFNDIPYEDYSFYMHDPIHPYKAGYLKWWTPYFEDFLSENLA